MAAGATYTPLASTTIGTAVASYTFSSISGSYTDLVAIITASTSNASSQVLGMTMNGDTTALYSTTRMYGNGTTASSDRFSAQNSVDVGYLAGTGGTGNSQTIVQIQNYSNATTYKSCLYRWNSENAGATLKYTAAGVGLWRNTAAITSLGFSFAAGNITAGSTFALYGIAAA